MTEENETGLTADALVERAASAIRDLSGAREANEEGASRLLLAYENVTAANKDLAEEVLAREQAHASDIEKIARQQGEIDRLTAISREAVQALRSSREECDRLKDDVRASREDFAKLNATHDNLIETNTKLTSTVERLLTEMSSGSRGIRDGSRRLSDIVATPSPARPRASRSADQAERSEPRQERDGRESPERGPRLVREASAARPGEEVYLEDGDRADVDDILDGFSHVVPLNARAQQRNGR